jgi:hypothetical protein
MRSKLLAGAAGLMLCAAPAAASARSSDYLTSNGSLLAGTTLSLNDEGRTEILERVVLHGAIPIPGSDQWVTVTVRRDGKLIRNRRLLTDPETGRYRMPLRLTGCCEYVAQTTHGSDVSSSLPFEASAPATLQPGSRKTRYFNYLLRRGGYHMGAVTDRVDESTGLAIMALRKVNDLPRTEEYEPGLFKMLLRGEGGFEPVHRDQDRHVEVDISRQVMALVEDGKATDVFHVSTGAFGTPRGEYSFYSRGPGYNAKGMYYSVYYSGNYATHGYYSVPTYPASHGCVRNPEAYSIFIYDWITLGDKIYVYD